MLRTFHFELFLVSAIARALLLWTSGIDPSVLPVTIPAPLVPKTSYGTTEKKNVYNKFKDMFFN